ncbi:hypothetical protein JOB18_012806 [Solea senegalensis]|uniref:Uncharacterized protein n=1 Tax=Solea senegalensis TaxID=28829 RepID=A0AAV6SEZ8_SOLSE|nr:uncharacterized protein LOC122779682 [Solea senegalensis]KAG7515645.1 hypothetical protein JOB18_012806 [Solea senegalensis]
MSNDVDRSKVLKSIKVMKAVKKDGSWIHKANPGKKEQDKSRTDVAKDNSSSPVKKKSYVLSAVKKFETRVSEEEVSKNGEVQPEIANANTAEENKGGYANICGEVHVQNGDAESVSLSKGNPEAREENKEEYPDTRTFKESTIPDMMVSQSPTVSHAVPEDVVKSLPETPAANKLQEMKKFYKVLWNRSLFLCLNHLLSLL